MIVYSTILELEGTCVSIMFRKMNLTLLHDDVVERREHFLVSEEHRATVQGTKAVLSV